MARVMSARAAVLQQNEKIGQYSGNITPMARLDVDGQNGITTDYRTLNAMTPYVKQNLLCFVLEVPRGFAFLPGGDQLAIGLKCLMETCSESIDGLDGTLRANFAQVVAGANEMLDVFTHSTLERSEPSHTFTERYGMAIYHLIETWIIMLLGDPRTRIPGIVTLAQSGASGVGGNMFSQLGQGYNAYTLLPENTSMTCLYVEPDPTCSYPVKAFLCANMMPDSPGSYTGSMEKQGSPSTEQVTIKFTCIQEIGPGPMNLAANVLSKVNKIGLSSNNRRAYLGDNYEEVAASVLRNARVGFMHQAQAIATTESIDSMKDAVLRKESLVGGNQDAAVNQRATGNGVPPGPNIG